MTLLMILLSLLLLGLIPVGIAAGYDNGDAQVSIVIGFLKFNLCPRVSKSKNAASEKKRKKEKFQSHTQVKKKKRDLTDYFPLVQLVFDFLKDFHAKLRVNDLRLKVILAGSDPCDLSIHYGRSWAAVGNIMPLLDNVFLIKNRNIEIACDYTAETTYYSGYINATLKLFQVLAIVVYHGARILKKYYNLTNKAKDGAVS